MLNCVVEFFLGGDISATEGIREWSKGKTLALEVTRRDTCDRGTTLTGATGLV